ncbi:MAG: metal-sulfur cluster assembly factor [Deltaproteobacteria bacterium]|nr:metal-sulfur cluster assembly factor [Deltaproteobacteria bacterium]
MDTNITPNSPSEGTGAPTSEQLMEALKPIIDPEIGIAIVDLGLIYKTEMLPDGLAYVLHSLTSPMCPFGPQLMSEIHQAVAKVPGVKDVKVEVTFNPPWDPKTMASDDVKMMLGIF